MSCRKRNRQIAIGGGRGATINLLERKARCRRFSATPAGEVGGSGGKETISLIGQRLVGER